MVELGRKYINWNDVQEREMYGNILTLKIMALDGHEYTEHEYRGKNVKG